MASMTQRMTGKQRLMAAHRGQPVDRVPIWLREGFPVGEPYPERGHYTLGWMHDPLYVELFQDIAPHADAIRGWGLNGWTNRYLMVPPHAIHTETTQVAEGVRRIDGYIETPRGNLPFLTEVKRGVATVWHLKTPVETLEDLKMLFEVPWDFEPSDVEQYIVPGKQIDDEPANIGVTADDVRPDFETSYAELGDRGIMRLGMSSPIVVISGCMTLEMFLEMSVTQRPFFHELCEEITRRYLCVIDAVFEGRDLDTTVNFGGSEQCTPPMMSPRAFDEYVVPYDGQLVRRLKEYGILVNYHVHGKVRHALKCLVDMGVDSTDPVEPPPAGDVTYAEAREIADGKLTLIGNLEWDELCFSEPEQIRRRVKEILDLGTDRLILGASAGPVSAITSKIADNYRAWIETALEFG